MQSRLIVLAAMLAAGSAQAQDLGSQKVAPQTLGPQTLGPMQGQTVILGDVTGVVYYTADPIGYRVVATLGSPAGAPIRFITTLQPDQSFTVSVPRGAGERALEAVFTRQGDRLLVSQHSAQDRRTASCAEVGRVEAIQVTALSPPRC